MHAWLKTAIPKLASLDIERSVVFFEHLGFERVAVHPTVALMRRGEMDLHFWLAADPAIAHATGCRVQAGQAADVDALYAEYLPLGVVHPADPLGDTPWATREFSIIDLDGNVLTFAAGMPA